jgi:hypothetical protein
VPICPPRRPGACARRSPAGLPPATPRGRRIPPLPEEAFLAAAARQDAECCIATLAARSGVPSDLIRRAGRLRSARALLAIAWKAGFSPAVALPVQTVVGGLPPEAALAATPGTWPLSPAEMQAHLDRLLGG